MQKSGDGGVSHDGTGMDDESIAAAMEEHFAPFASAKRSLAEAAAIAGEMDAAHEHPDDDDADPEVTAITRKFEESHDTLGAINDLQQLLIERTGQIPVIQVPQPAAAEPAVRQPEAPAPAPAPEASAPAIAEPERPAAVVEPEQEPELMSEPDGLPLEPLLDWALTPVPEPANAPGFSPWVDPEQIAAARDDAPARSYSDVSTQVFSVFSAKPDAPFVPDEPEVLDGAPAEPAAPEALPPVVPLIEAVPEELAVEAAPAATASAPILTSTGSIDITPRLERADLDEDDDVIDDTDRVDRAVHTAPPPETGSAPPPAWGLTFDKVIAAPPAEPAAALPVAAPIAPPVQTPAEPEQQPTRRRWWPFGRR